MKSKKKMIINSINDICGIPKKFTEEEIRCTLSFLAGKSREALKKEFPNDVTEVLGKPYDPFLETIVKMRSKAIDDAQGSMARFEAFEKFYEILK